MFHIFTVYFDQIYAALVFQEPLKILTDPKFYSSVKLYYYFILLNLYDELYLFLK